MRLRNLVRPIDTIRARARLLKPREHRERRTRTDTRNAKQLPAIRNFPARRPQKVNALQMQVLRNTKTKPIAHIERRRTALRMRVEGILRKSLRHSSCRTRPTDYL